MTGEADRVTVGTCFESTLLQPESIADCFGRLDYVFLARISLRLIRFMTNGAALGRRRFLLLKQRIDKRRATVGVQSHYVNVLVMRKADAEFRNEFSPLQLGISDIAKTWE